MQLAAQYDKVEKKQVQQVYNEGSKKNLKSSTTKRIRTTFIGIIDKVEKSIGDLWGFGLHQRDCTPEQLKFRARWEELRNDILNHGNHQIRLNNSEVDEYEVTWKRIRNLPIVPLDK
jgi:hypothetical protein